MTKRIAREMLIRVLISLMITFAFYAFEGTETQAAVVETNESPVERPADSITVGVVNSSEEEQEATEGAFEEYYEMFVHGMAEMVETFEKLEK